MYILPVHSYILYMYTRTYTGRFSSEVIDGRRVAQFAFERKTFAQGCSLCHVRPIMNMEMWKSVHKFLFKFSNRHKFLPKNRNQIMHVRRDPERPKFYNNNNNIGPEWHLFYVGGSLV